MTIPQRILFHVALGAGLVIAVATTVTYGIVYNAARQRDLQHLKTYVKERARREEIGFQHVQGNLALVRGQFLKRMEGAVPRDYDRKWNQRFRLFDDGAWRSREEFVDGRKFATLWAHKNCLLSPGLQTQILRAQDLCNELLPGWVDSFPSVYFVLPGWANIGFDPRIPNWVWDTPADYDATDLEWFQLALPKTPRTNAFSWTAVIEEPTTKSPIVSVYLPIHKDGQFLGSIGHDLSVNRLLNETARSDLPGAMHVIFRADGRIIAHPAKRKEILSSTGRLSMQNSGESALVSLYESVIRRKDERQFSDYDRSSEVYYSVARLAGPEWFFLTTMPRDLLQRQAFQSAQWVLWSGLISLALLLTFLATTLRRQIAFPLAELARATRQMSAGDISATANVQRADELGALAHSFNEMAGRVRSRDADLRQLNQELEERVALRTTELREANHNLDKAHVEALQALARERELSELKSEFVSLVSHEFRTPLEIIMSSVDNLQRYHDRLPPDKRAQLLRTVNKSVRRMSDMMEEVLVLGRLETDRMTFKPAAVDLHTFCRRLCDEIESATGSRCPINFSFHASETAHADESILRHIFTNLLSNAVKYSPAGKVVDFQIDQQGTTAFCRITDRGCGIPEADQKRLFQAFHRGSNVSQTPGTGLGLLIVKRCVDLHGGEIGFESAQGKGTCFTLKLPIFLVGGEVTRL